MSDLCNMFTLWSISYRPLCVQVLTGSQVLSVEAVCHLDKGGIYFLSGPIWRASFVSTIAMLSVILLIDGLAHARIAEYNDALLKAQQELRK